MKQTVVMRCLNAAQVAKQKVPIDDIRADMNQWHLIMKECRIS